MTYDQPNYTQVPNDFFDIHLPEIDTLAELKCALVVIRQTFGWHKGKDRISYSQFEKKTGLSLESIRQGTRKGTNL